MDDLVFTFLNTFDHTDLYYEMIFSIPASKSQPDHSLQFPPLLHEILNKNHKSGLAG